MFFWFRFKDGGVEELLRGMETYAQCPVYREAFGARVYKISRDDQGNRLTHLKVTGGVLKVKMPLETGEKVDQIRIYSGAGFQTAQYRNLLQERY